MILNKLVGCEWLFVEFSFLNKILIILSKFLYIMVEEMYEYPYSIFKKYFPNGTEEEFDKSFVSFDVSEEDFHLLT